MVSTVNVIVTTGTKTVLAPVVVDGESVRRTHSGQLSCLRNLEVCGISRSHFCFF